MTQLLELGVPCGAVSNEYQRKRRPELISPHRIGNADADTDQKI